MIIMVSTKAPLVSAVIPSWNGLELLKESLPAAFLALEQSGYRHEVIVIDDGSSDDTQEWLRHQWKSVRSVRLPHNQGFAVAVNTGVAKCRGEYVWFLNNDLIPFQDSVAPLVQALAEDDVFCATMRLITRGSVETGAPKVSIVRNQLFFRQENVTDRAGNIDIFYGGGGSSLFKRHELGVLGGLSLDYRPFYFEDVDLGWRAWQRGWRSVYVSRSAGVHKLSGTIGKNFDRSYVNGILEKNRMVLHIRNLDNDGLRPYLRTLAARAVKHAMGGDVRFGLDALGASATHYVKRRELISARVLSDKEILERCDAQFT